MAPLASALRTLRERPFWLALLFGLIAITAAYQRPVFLDVGSRTDALYTSGFHDPEESGQATFRWTTASSTVNLPGLGKPLATMPVTLQMSSGSRNEPVEVELWTNGDPITTFVVEPESAPYTIDVGQRIDPSGNLRLDVKTTTFKAPGDKRDLGVILDFVRIETPVGSTLPSISQLLLI